MACPRFEDLLEGGRAATDHAARCERCAALLEAWAEVDASLEHAFANVSAPEEFAARARARALRETRLRRPSIVPEVLDFIGWAAIVALVAVLIPRFLPAIQAMLARLG